MPHLESKTKPIMTASVNWYINPIIKDNKDNYTPNGEDNKDNFKIIDY